MSEQNRAWMAQDRGRRVRQKLPNRPKSNKRKPGQAPAGRTRARTGAGSERECHVEIEWIAVQLPTPHLGGWALEGVGAAHHGSRCGVKRKCVVG